MWSPPLRLCPFESLNGGLHGPAVLHIPKQHPTTSDQLLASTIQYRTLVATVRKGCHYVQNWISHKSHPPKHYLRFASMFLLMIPTEWGLFHGLGRILHTAHRQGLLGIVEVVFLEDAGRVSGALRMRQNCLVRQKLWAFLYLSWPFNSFLSHHTQIYATCFPREVSGIIFFSSI